MAFHPGMGSSVFLCLFFPVMIYQQCCPFPSVRMRNMSLPMFPCVVQEADKIPPRRAQCLTAAFPSTALLTSPMAAAFLHFSISLVSAFTLHSAFLSRTLQCLPLYPLFFCLRSLTCWRHFLHLGKSSSLTHPESWEQEAVSSFSSFQNILGHNDTAGIKAGTHQKHPNQEEQP